MKVELNEKDLINELLNTFSYDDSGNLIWRNCKYNPRLIGTVAGSIHKSGYRRITWLGKTWTIHRLIYAWHHHHFPEEVIDHKDGDKLNNRIENLRNVTCSVNRQNLKKAQSNNNLGFLGVRKCGSSFQARIRSNGKLHSLGYFKTLEEAAAAYKQVKQLLHEGYIYEG